MSIIFNYKMDQEISMISGEYLETEHVKNVYNQIAEKFDHTRTYYWASVKQFLLSIDKSDEKKILDLGCGNGRYVKLFGQLQTFCLDNSEELIKIVSTRYPHVQTICSDVTEIPFSNNYFDYVISIAVIHHLSTETRRIQMIIELYRVLKPGGLSIVTAWANSTPTDKFTKINEDSDYFVPWNGQHPRFYHLFSSGEFESIILKSGLESKLIVKQVINECDNWAIIVEKIE